MGFNLMLPLMADHLIELMMLAVLVALYCRYAAYRSCAQIQSQVKGLSRGVEKALTQVKREGEVDAWMKDLFQNVEEALPDHGLRMAAQSASIKRMRDGVGNVEDFMAIKRNLSQSIMAQTDALRSSTRPNFTELANRVLTTDPRWQRIFKIVNVDTLQRVLSILPSLFVIGGILGTFIGISSALPMVGTIDLGNLDASGPILNKFVDHIAFSMHTSIAGIAFSVIMTLLNTLFPLTVVRKDVQNVLADVFENLWNDIHKDSISLADRKIIELLNNLVQIRKAG